MGKPLCGKVRIVYFSSSIVAGGGRERIKAAAQAVVVVVVAAGVVDVGVWAVWDHCTARCQAAVVTDRDPATKAIPVQTRKLSGVLGLAQY